MTALQLASRAGHEAAVLRLLHASATVGPHGAASALALASTPSVARHLVQHGADVSDMPRKLVLADETLQKLLAANAANPGQSGHLADVPGSTAFVYSKLGGSPKPPGKAAVVPGLAMPPLLDDELNGHAPNGHGHAPNGHGLAESAGLASAASARPKTTRPGAAQASARGGARPNTARGKGAGGAVHARAGAPSMASARRQSSPRASRPGGGGAAGGKASSRSAPKPKPGAPPTDPAEDPSAVLPPPSVLPPPALGDRRQSMETIDFLKVRIRQDQPIPRTRNKTAPWTGGLEGAELEALAAQKIQAIHKMKSRRTQHGFVLPPEYPPGPAAIDFSAVPSAVVSDVVAAATFWPGPPTTTTRWVALDGTTKDNPRRY